MQLLTAPSLKNPSMPISPLTALSPVDGRYAEQTEALREWCSEYALIRHRVLVEIRWLLYLADTPELRALPPFSPSLRRELSGLAADFAPADAKRVKAIEKKIRHDMKAVEYYLRERLDALAAKRRIPKNQIPLLHSFLHFGCTSDDINNLAWGLMLKGAREQVLLPLLGEIIQQIKKMARQSAAIPMLARTHGQPASPTTFGKEMSVFASRLARRRERLAEVPVLGKMNGATGNYNAHVAACPQVNWPRLSEKFVRSLGLSWNSHTTQIEDRDWMAEMFSTAAHCNSILLDLCRDLWGYTALGYLEQQAVPGEVGSSAMPHKVNPIDFENAEGNLGVANALLRHLAEKLPISRWQRDLSDYTAMRNAGSAFGNSVVAYRSVLQGLKRVKPAPAAMRLDLEKHWEVLGEAVQTVLRCHGIPDAYERLKKLTRGQTVDRAALQKLVAELEIPEAERARLLALEPADYLGLAPQLARATGGKPGAGGKGAPRGKRGKG